jgi:hypothetical protein
MKDIFLIIDSKGQAFNNGTGYHCSILKTADNGSVKTADQRTYAGFRDYVFGIPELEQTKL